MKYPVAESTGVAHENIDEMLDQNLAEHMLNKYDLHGTIGPQPDYWIKPGKNIFGQEVAGMEREEALEYAGGLAMGSVGGGPQNLGKGILKFLKQWKNPPKTMREFRRMANVNPGGYSRMKGRVKQYLETSKPYQQARKKFKEWDQPELLESDPIMNIADRTKLHTIEDIGGKKGLDRFFSTIGAKDSPMNNPRVRAAMRDTMEERILGTKIAAVPKTYNLKETLKGPWGQRIGGRAYTGGVPGDMSRARVEFGRSTPGHMESTGRHEFTHVGQLQGSRSANWLDRMSKKHKLTGDEMTWMQSNIYDRPVAGTFTPGRNPNRIGAKRWEDAYMEKLYPHLKPGAKEWYDKFHAGKKPYRKLIGKDKDMEYMLRPKEFSARGSQIRHEIDKMIAGDKSQKKAGSLLERLTHRERKYVTDEGLDMMVNKLWGLGPVGVGLSFQEGKAKK